MPGILVPISSGPNHLSNGHHQHLQQHIILATTPAPPPPPPLDLISNIKVEMKPVISSAQATSTPIQLQPPPIIADRPIKIEFIPPPQYDVAPTKPMAAPKQPPAKGKAATKSQVMTDVLEILIKNGELPETAVFDPTTPTSSAPSNTNSINQQSMHQSQNPMLFSTLVSQVDQQIPDPTKDKCRTDGTARSSSTLLLDTHHPHIDNVEMLSPMQPDCDNSISFDMFMERQEQKQAQREEQLLQQQQQHQQQQQQPLNEQERQRLRLEELNRANELHTAQHASSSPFDDLELMELMGQQLDMDMNDDPCHQYTLNNHMRLLNNENNICNDDGGSKINRRDPSLQPSLNELIQQQQQQSQQNFSNTFGICHSNNNNNSNHSSNNGTSNNSNANNNNNNNHNSPNIMDHLSYSSTPMDIEDFESSLSSFDFSQITGVSNEPPINTPPHMFGQSNTVGQAQQSQQQQMLHSQPTGSHLHNHNHQHHMLNNCVESMSSHDAYDTPLALNSENILDLFNIEDFRMSNDNSLPWSEVDFAA